MSRLVEDGLQPGDKGDAAVDDVMKHVASAGWIGTLSPGPRSALGAGDHFQVLRHDRGVNFAALEITLLFVKILNIDNFC